MHFLRDHINQYCAKLLDTKEDERSSSSCANNSGFSRNRRDFIDVVLSLEFYDVDPVLCCVCGKWPRRQDNVYSRVSYHCCVVVEFLSLLTQCIHSPTPGECDEILFDFSLFLVFFGKLFSCLLIRRRRNIYIFRIKQIHVLSAPFFPSLRKVLGRRHR